MSKNEKKERENTKLQRKNNKLTEVNRKRGKDNERPLSEGGKSSDISKTFPNFSALTETERLIFFQALTTARKNVEERGVPTRQCFGTIHDEYLKYFTQDQKEEKEVLENPKETSYLTSNTSIHDSNTSSCINKSAFKLNPRDFSGGRSRSPTSKIRVTNWKGNNKPVINEPGSWDHCESVIQKDTRGMIDLYLRKKERNARKSNNVQLTNEKLIKNMENKTPELCIKKNAEGERKKANVRARTSAKTTLKVRNTSRFDALNAEEKEIFFRTLQKAHDNVVEKNPEKEREILPLSAIMERYLDDRQATAVFTTSQEPRRREDRRRNLRVKVILTSGDNERLSKTKSQVLSDAMREFSDRRHKSAESLSVEGKEPSGTNETHDRADQSESSFYNIGKASKDSLEINEKNTSKLNGQKETIQFEKVKEKEKNSEECLKPQTKEKKKTKRKEKKSSKPRKLKTAPIPTYELKSTDGLKISHLDLPVTADTKKIIKGTEREFKVQNKNRSKSKIQKIKKEQEKEKVQKKEELLKQGLLFELKNYPYWKNVEDHQNMKESYGSMVIKEQYPIKAEECRITDAKEMHENCEKETFEMQVTSAGVSCSEENCEGTCASCEDEQNEKTVKEIGKNEEIVNKEEKDEVECTILCERRKEGEAETTVTSEQREEKSLEIISESLRSVTTEEAALSDSNLRSQIPTKEESTTAVKSLIFDDNNCCCCEAERIKTPLESGQENPEPLVVETQKEITAEASMLQEIFKEASFVEEKPRKEKETKKIASGFAPGKVMFVDDNVIEKVKKLIFYLEAKIQKDDYLEKEYLQLLLDYVDYLSKVLESLVLREERQQKQVQETYTAAEVHLKFNDISAPSQKKENTSLAGKDFIPRSMSDQNLRRMYSTDSVAETKGEKPKDIRSSKKSIEEVSMLMESGSSSDSETEVLFTPINTGDKKVLTTNIRLLQDLLHQRAEFVEGSIADFKIVHHPEAEDFVPREKPPTVEYLTDEDEENKQQDHKIKFFKVLLKCCTCGKKKTEDDGIFKNLKGEAVRADVYDEKKDDAASATLNQSTMEVLKAAERKKIIEKYYSQD